MIAWSALLAFAGTGERWEDECASMARAKAIRARADRQGLLAPTGKPVQPRIPGEFEPKATLHLVYSPYAHSQAAVAGLVSEALHVGRVVVHLAFDAPRRSLAPVIRPTEGLEVRRSELSSIWIRDYGGLWIESDGRPGLVDPRYYDDCIGEDVWPSERARHFGVPVFRPPFALEGGNLLSDGHGTCFTTTEFALRNHATPTAMQQPLAEWLGCERTVFLEPLLREPTGHIDLLMTVADPRTLLVASVPKSEDPLNHLILNAHARQLGELRATDGRPYRIIRVPMAGLMNQPVRSYVNLTPFNSVVFVPTYSGDTRFEAAALAVIRRAFPGRDVVAVPSESYVDGNGGGPLCDMGRADLVKPPVS